MLRRTFAILRLRGPGAGVALAMVLAMSSAARAGEALIAVASNFADVARFLAADYSAISGHKITVATGSTGKIYAQIVHGAPYDAMLSADQARPARLEAEGRAVPGSRFTFAVGRLALWSADAAMIEGDGAAVLRAGDFAHLAIAHPRLAPYGLAAQQVMQRLGVWDAVQPKLATGENIGQTHALVSAGAAQLGFVALSQVQTGVTGSMWAVPQDLHDPISQDAVLLWHGAENPAAIGFLEFLDSGGARSFIRASGYGTL